MKEKNLKFTKTRTFRVFNISRQAYYKHQKVMVQNFLKEQVIVDAVKNIRNHQPRVGGKKLHRMLKAMDFHIGRDKLFAILRKNNLLVKPLRSYRKTTNSFHRFRKYPNLIKELDVTKPNEVFVADITYLDTLEGFCYLSLISDLYSRKIMGWHLSKSLAVEGCQRALRMAFRAGKNVKNLIHHSDRGMQYCSNNYVKILNKNKIKISMTEENHVYQNAVAERINGILKSEFLLGETLHSYQVAKELVRESIKIYNEQRLHTSLNYQTPEYRYAA